MPHKNKLEMNSEIEAPTDEAYAEETKKNMFDYFKRQWAMFFKTSNPSLEQLEELRDVVDDRLEDLLRHGAKTQ